MGGCVAEWQTHTDHTAHEEYWLHQWMFATRWGQPGGSGGVDDLFVLTSWLDLKST
jgi:hypothetical protein